MDAAQIADLDAEATLAAAERTVRTRRAADLEHALLLLHWCDLNADDPQAKPGAVPVRYGGDKLVEIGGEGTPKVAELALGEFAIAHRMGEVATSNFAADMLDLRHRLPRVFTALRDLVVDLWVARKVAKLSRRLATERVALVDAAVAAAVHETPQRILAVAEAKVIEADLDGYAERVRTDARRKGVWLARKPPGQRLDAVDGEPEVQRINARLSTSDAVELDQVLDDLAEALLVLHEADDHEDALTFDQARAEALGVLADPYAAVRLLEGLDDGEQQPTTPKPRKRRPATIYVHLHAEVVQGRLPGVARVEQLGPMLLEQVRDLLRHRDVTVTPVLDLNHTTSVSAYEIPEAVKHRTLLRTSGDVFPHSGSRATRRLDHDHAVPYDKLGPPGQTGDHNDAPLTRRHHRIKTHRGYSVSQLALGAYRWVTPHGLARLVTPAGTHDIGLLRGADRRVMGETYRPRVLLE